MFDRKIFVTINRPLTWLRARLSRRWEARFYDALFAMLAKLCQADGEATGDTLDVVSAFISAELQFRPKKKMQAMAAFRKGRSSPLSFEDFAVQFHKMCGPGPAIRQAMVDLLLTVAIADNSFSRNEARLVQVAVKVFGISEKTYNRMKERHLRFEPEVESNRQETHYQQYREKHSEKKERTTQPSELELAYRTLESAPSSSLSEIKARYRRLAKRYHPDRYAHSNIPPEVVAFYAARFRELQLAYDLIQKARPTEKTDKSNN